MDSRVSYAVDLGMKRFLARPECSKELQSRLKREADEMESRGKHFHDLETFAVGTLSAFLATVAANLAVRLLKGIEERSREKTRQLARLEANQRRNELRLVIGPNATKEIVFTSEELDLLAEEVFQACFDLPEQESAGEAI